MMACFRCDFKQFCLVTVVLCCTWYSTALNTKLFDFRANILFRTRPTNHASCWGVVEKTLLAAAARKGTTSSAEKNKDEGDEENIFPVDVEILDSDEEESTDDWVPDSVKARQQRYENRAPLFVENEEAAAQESQSLSTGNEDGKGKSNNDERKPSAYTEEEEEVIASMGGKTASKHRRREIGYLGDSTLREIAQDYSVPVVYLADVLCMWGVLPPIPIDDVPLGDMVTGEQAFAILEAVNSLDVGALNDRYSNTNLRQLCFEFDIDLQEAFSMAMKEGWSLPFGVETCLRVEQEDELLRVLMHENSRMTSESLVNDDENDI